MPAQSRSTVVRTAVIAAGVSVFVEVGPGKVLSGLLKRIDKNATAISVQSMADVAQRQQGAGLAGG